MEHQETMIHELPYDCPQCGRANSAPISESINAGFHPELRDRLLSRELVLLKCRHCGQEGFNAHPIVYHDMSRTFLIQWVSAPYAPTLDVVAKGLGREASAECAIFKQLSPDYRFRFVREFEDLQEKIRVFEAGPDDRAIEWLKLFHSRTLEGAPGRPKLEAALPRFRRWVEVQGERRMEFTLASLRPGPKSPGSFSLLGPAALHERTQQDLDAHLPWPAPIAGAFLLVDQAYVARSWERLPYLGLRRPGDG